MNASVYVCFVCVCMFCVCMYASVYVCFLDICVCMHDRVRKDMIKFKIEKRSWFSLAQERSSWRGKCRAGLEEATRKRVEEDELKCTANAMRSAGGSGSVAATKPFHCDTCLRYFRCPQDIARHRCMTTRPRGQVMRPPLKGSQLFTQSAT